MFIVRMRRPPASSVRSEMWPMSLLTELEGICDPLAINIPLLTELFGRT